MRAHTDDSQTQTFSLTGAETAPFLAGGGWALVDGHSFLVALRAGDFVVHVIRQVPQQTDAVLYQLKIKTQASGTCFIRGAAASHRPIKVFMHMKADVAPYSHSQGQNLWVRVTPTLLSTSLQSIWDWTMYMSESTNPVHSLSFLLASLRSELTFLWTRGKMRRGKTKHGLAPKSWWWRK